MSPRHRSISDSTLLAVAATVLEERGLEQLRLSDVAAASQLAAPTLVQRFGSREGLLDALATSFVREVRSVFVAAGPPPLTALAGALHHLAATQHIRFFLARPAQAAAYATELRKHIAFSLVAAIETGQLAPCDIAAQARRLQLGYFGAAAAALLEGSALTAEDVRHLVDETLADYQ